METVTLKNSLDTHSTVESLIIKIIQKVRDIPNVSNLKADIELTRFVCCVIENEIPKTDKNQIKPDKKAIFLRIMNEVFISPQLTEDDRINLSKQIDYLLANNKIRRNSSLRVGVSIIKNWILKKLA
jgi:hypothetical protein